MPLPVCTRREPDRDRRLPLMAVVVLLATVMMMTLLVSIESLNDTEGDAEKTWTFGDNNELIATSDGGTLTICTKSGLSSAVSLSTQLQYPWQSESGLAKGITKIVIKGEIDEIGYSVFSDFSDLEIIDLNSSEITWLFSDCFKGATGLKQVVFPDIDAVVTVMSEAFIVDLGDGKGKLLYDKEDSKQSPENFAGRTFVWCDTHKMLCETLTHSVTYDVNGGDVSAPDKQKVAEGAKFNLASYDGKKEGFEFKGWDYKGTTYQAGYEMTMGQENIVLTAVWEKPEIVYTVTFLLNGGEGSFPQMSCHSGDKITISSVEPAKDSFTFDGWDCDGVRYSAGQVVTVNSDMTFTAQWKADGGSDPITPVTPVVPIFPGDEQEAIEIITDDEKDGSKDNEKTVLIIGIVVAIIAILAVMSVSKRE